jgi:hypothetical protein
VFAHLGVMAISTDHPHLCGPKAVNAFESLGRKQVSRRFQKNSSPASIVGSKLSTWTINPRTGEKKSGDKPFGKGKVTGPRVRFARHKTLLISELFCPQILSLTRHCAVGIPDAALRGPGHDS